MSRPKKGYRRKSLDLKESTVKKIALKAIGKDTTPKELCEEILENHFNKAKEQ